VVVEMELAQARAMQELQTQAVAVVVAPMMALVNWAVRVVLVL
jgi:hypothetical protein